MTPTLSGAAHGRGAEGYLQDPLIRDLLGTFAVQRLRDVAFLGALGYVVDARRGRTGRAAGGSRYEHSIGVMALAWEYAVDRDLSPRRRALACAAALLHDIGHPPLSHSAEPVFAEVSGADHNGTGAALLRGFGEHGDELFCLLRDHRVEMNALRGLIFKGSAEFDGFFSGPINFDTVEGIARSLEVAKGGDAGFVPRRVLTAAAHRRGEADRDAVDGFWERKGAAYSSFIRSPEGVLADHAATRMVGAKQSELDRDSCYLTDTELFERIPALHILLRAPNFAARVARQIDGRVLYTARHYEVDEAADFFARNDKRRYVYSQSMAYTRAGEIRQSAADMPSGSGLSA